MRNFSIQAHTRLAPFAVAALSLFLLLAGPTSNPAAAAQELTSEQVRNALTRGINYLASQQVTNGSFLTAGLGQGPYPVGPTALATLALLNAGASPRDPVIVRAALLEDLPGARRHL